jgi:Ca2+:H+ antiporter
VSVIRLWNLAGVVATSAGLWARWSGWPDVVVFALASVALVPFALLIGEATDALARRIGPRWGGLLNATFGNAAELILSLLAIHRGLLTLVKAAITGSIISNTLAVLGTALVVGGLRHGGQRFDSQRASLNAAMMILALSGLYLPAAVAQAGEDRAVLQEISLLVAGILLVTYGAYLAFTARTSMSVRPVDETGPPTPGRAWSARRATGVLAGAMAGAAVSSELLVGAIQGLTRSLGWNEIFLGMVVIGLVGNAAEHWSAVQMAWRDRLDVTFAIAAGSSLQIALLVAPLLTFASLGLGHPMTLIFSRLELGTLVPATAIFAYLSLDGRTSWLEGVQLLAVYVLAASTIYLVPAR